MPSFFMYTLNNVDNPRSRLAQSARLTPRTPSSNTATGVSVSNVQAEPACWHVIRVSYNREQKANDWLKGKGFEVFLPMRHKVKTVDGKRKKVATPLIPNLLFVRATTSAIDRVLRDSANTCFSYYYNHFALLPDGKNPPLTVPDHQMDGFIRLATVDDPNILFLSRDNCRFKSGDKVIVTSGPFKDVVGRVVRAKRQQRVAVEIDGLGVVTTAYVPSGCMEKITQNC